MRKTEFPQIGQVPFTAGLPFFIVTCCGFLISTFRLSLTQYASAMSPFLLPAGRPGCDVPGTFAPAPSGMPLGQGGAIDAQSEGRPDAAPAASMASSILARMLNA